MGTTTMAYDERLGLSFLISMLILKVLRTTRWHGVLAWRRSSWSVVLTSPVIAHVVSFFVILDISTESPEIFPSIVWPDEEYITACTWSELSHVLYFQWRRIGLALSSSTVLTGSASRRPPHVVFWDGRKSLPSKLLGVIFGWVLVWMARLSYYLVLFGLSW